MITYLLDTLVNSIKTSLINKLGLDPSTEVDLDDFPQLIDDIPILDSVEELTVTENGTYAGTEGVTYNPVNVNLPLGSKSVTANGTYTASDDSLQGYSEVTVDIDDTDLYRDTTDSTYESVKTLSNCGAFPMLSLKVGIEPIQGGSGDPSPTNIRPISGWDEVNVNVCGTNVWDEEWKIDGAQFKAKNLIPVMPNTSYYFKSPLNAYSAFKYDVNGNSLGPMAVMTKDAVFATDSKTYYIWFSLSVNDYGTTYNNDISINYPSTDTEYHAYNGHTYTIDLDGTRYGGTLDVVSGVLTVDEIFGELDGVDENWANTAAGSVGNRSNFLLNVFPSTDIDTDFVTICNTYIGRSYNHRTFNTSNITWVNPDGSVTVVTDSSIDTAEKFKALLQDTPLQIITKLATPQTIQLTPTQVKSLLGTNNLWADTGDVGDVRYFKKVEL